MSVLLYGTWNTIECWFLLHLFGGWRLSQGILALTFRPLNSNMSLLPLRLLRPSKLHKVTFSWAEISYTISWPMINILLEFWCVFNAINLMIEDNSHQQTGESQILFQPWWTVDRKQCPAANQTKRVSNAILHHWLKPFVAYCTEMSEQ